MCGIFLYISKDNNAGEGSKYFNKLKHRGPDKSSYDILEYGVGIGFHRLSINDTTDAGMQPFKNETQYIEKAFFQFFLLF